MADMLTMSEVWFQNRRAKWRKKENTKKGPGRPAHNAHPQTCSGTPIDPDELKQKEQERIMKKRMKQLEKKKLDKNGKIQKLDVPQPLDDGSKHRSPFSIDSLLAAPKVPRGRRPNSKYPRVQACKSMNPLSVGLMPLFPVTQPVGFVVEQVADDDENENENENENDSRQLDYNSDEPSDLSKHGNNNNDNENNNNLDALNDFKEETRDEHHITVDDDDENDDEVPVNYSNPVKFVELNNENENHHEINV